MDLAGSLRKNSAYAFGAVGVAWTVVLVFNGSLLVFWPALIFFVGALLLKLYPLRKLTRGWSVAAPFSGIVLSGYQAYSSVGFLTGSFGSIALTTLIVFAAMAVASFLLLAWGRPLPSKGQ